MPCAQAPTDLEIWAISSEHALNKPFSGALHCRHLGESDHNPS